MNKNDIDDLAQQIIDMIRDDIQSGAIKDPRIIKKFSGVEKDLENEKNKIYN
jgi:hypothetical protein